MAQMPEARLKIRTDIVIPGIEEAAAALEECSRASARLAAALSAMTGSPDTPAPPDRVMVLCPEPDHHWAGDSPHFHESPAGQRWVCPGEGRTSASPDTDTRTGQVNPDRAVRNCPRRTAGVVHDAHNWALSVSDQEEYYCPGW